MNSHVKEPTFLSPAVCCSWLSSLQPRPASLFQYKRAGKVSIAEHIFLEGSLNTGSSNSCKIGAYTRHNQAGLLTIVFTQLSNTFCGYCLLIVLPDMHGEKLACIASMKKLQE